MNYHDDMSHVNKEFLEKGLLKAVPYSIRLDRYFTEEEKAENRACAEKCTREEWNKRCDELRTEIAAENHELMKVLSAKLKIGGYDDSCKDYDLWFWCNDLYDTTSGKQSGRDYSYITLTFEDKNDYAKNEQIVILIKIILAEYPAKNIQAIFQYSSIENTEIIEKEAERIYQQNIGKFVRWGCSIGRLEKYNGEYCFKKKGAKRYGYIMKPSTVCSIKELEA